MSGCAPARGDRGGIPIHHTLCMGADPEGTVVACEQCGERIETSEWYLITSDRDDDGSLQLYPFCSEACQSAWLAERSE